MPWILTDDANQVQHARVVRFLDDLARFADPEHGILTDVRQRHEHSRTIYRKSIEEHRDQWEDAISEVPLSEHYNGFELTVQVGLVPIGPDPNTDLWEFWHVESGSEPERDVLQGKLQHTENTGLVFVLLPYACGAWPVLPVMTRRDNVAVSQLRF